MSEGLQFPDRLKEMVPPRRARKIAREVLSLLHHAAATQSDHPGSLLRFSDQHETSQAHWFTKDSDMLHRLVVTSMPAAAIIALERQTEHDYLRTSLALGQNGTGIFFADRGGRPYGDIYRATRKDIRSFHSELEATKVSLGLLSKG